MYDLARKTQKTCVLARVLRPADDHNAPALLALPDGRTIAVYSRHGQDRLMRWRIAAAHDPTNWGAERTADLGAGVTYSNIFHLAGEYGRLYNFHRGRGYDPNIAVSDDGGISWTYFAHLLENPNDPDNRIRPYVKYASDGRDTIHFVTTESHPQQSVSTSLYHGFLRAGRIHLSDGHAIETAGPADPAALTRIFAGDPGHRAWPCDLELDRAGHPVTVYSVHLTDEDHRYRYARWNGSRWDDQEIAFAGARLYPGEEHYTGLAAIDPDRPHIVYISANVDPTTGKPLISAGDQRRHFEIFKGVAVESGATWAWTWTPITRDSTVDNIRPTVPAWDGKHTALLWLRGTYTRYTDYNLEVVGVIE